jgi:hypothetical protein
LVNIYEMMTMISPTCNCNHTFSPLNLICAKICNIIYIISFSLKYKMLTMLQNSILQHNYSTLCDGSQTHLCLRYLTSTVLLAVCKSQSCPLHRTWHLNIHVILRQYLIGCRTILGKTSTQIVRQSTQNIYLHNQ